MLERLSVAHDELRAVMTAYPPDASTARADEVGDLTTAHLRDQERVPVGLVASARPPSPDGVIGVV